MALLDLSVELLQQIINEAIPEDFESLALSCKHLYAASQHYIRMYNKYNRYTLFKDGKYVSTPLQLLLEFAKNPDLARYIEYADFGHNRDDEDLIDMEVLDRANAETNRDQLESLLSKSLYLRETEQSCVEWSSGLRARHWPRELTIALVLTFLFEVKELRIPYRWSEAMLLPHSGTRTWRKLIRAIEDAADDISKPLAGLSKLTTLSRAHGGFYTTTGDTAEFTPFMTLKSVRNLYCGGRIVQPRLSRQLWINSPSMTSLRVVEMAGCCANGEDISLFLRSTPLLKVFKFSYESSANVKHWGWNAEAFVAAVEKEVGNNLEEFSLSLWNPRCLVGNAVTLLKGFKKLKILEFDIRLLLEEYDAFTRYSLGVPPRPLTSGLLHLLPPSVTSFHLLMNTHRKYLDHFEDLLLNNDKEFLKCLESNAKAGRDGRLPNLSHVEIRCGIARDEGNAGDNAGVISYALDSRRRLKHILESLEFENVFFAEESESLYDDFPCAKFMTGYFKRYGGNTPIGSFVF
jgi:hypothetical protein